MAKFFKHVGLHNGKKVVIVQRMIPGEAHMCSVLYSQIIPSSYHDDIMKVLESVEGQAANEFVDILRRRTARNGNNLLHAVAQEGYLKKVPTNQVSVRPNSASDIRLDELNNLLQAAGTGREAIERLEKLDSEQGYKDNRKTGAAAIAAEDTSGALSDSGLAQLNIRQAEKMKADAAGLLAEADRLLAEAATLDPTLAKTKGTTNRGKKTPA